MNDLTSTLYNGSSKCDESSFLNSTNIAAKQRRGMLDEDLYSNCEFTLQQKRHLESKLDKERNEREEAVENFKNIQKEYSRFKDITVQKETELVLENSRLKETLQECQARVFELEAEKHGLLKTVNEMEKTFQAHREYITLNDNAFRKQLLMLDKRDSRMRKITQKWLNSMEEKHANIAMKYDSLVERIVKLVFSTYSESFSKIKQYNDTASERCFSDNQTTKEEYKNIMDIMKQGVLLPPCRRKSNHNFLGSEKEREFISNLKQFKQKPNKNAEDIIHSNHSSVQNKTSSLLNNKSTKSLII